MLILLRDDMVNAKSKRRACVIKTTHAEFFPDRVEIIYPAGGDITYINVTKKGNFVWGDKYGYCIFYEDWQDYVIRETYPKAKWFKE